MGQVALPAYYTDAATIALGDECQLLDLDEIVAEKRVFFAFKRLADIVLSILALIVLAPLFAITALAIAIDDGFPVFFSQVRIGKGGRAFRIYKFRSMCRNAPDLHECLLEHNEADGPAFKMREDPGITRVGPFVRRMCIDELPQLINVIKGDMSLVGPRPLVVREALACNPSQA